MKSQLLIPKKIKVGFNLRNDTYTGKLGYVIYHDGKIWRKESSWNGWRHKEGQQINVYENGKHETKTLGPEINPLEFENIPTEGFVLNKKAGGYSSGWNHRATYCRVYDPRGFEFEISIPNLLFILQETSSFKGKGLEGEFVYSWEGKDLVLLPISCEDYKKSTNYTELQSGKISAKELIVGCSYKTKRQKDLIYLGKFNWYYMEGSYSDRITSTEKFHIFKRVSEDGFEVLSALKSLAAKNGDTPVSNYAELMEEFSNFKYSSKPVLFEEDAIEKIDFPIIKKDDYFSSGRNVPGRFFLKTSENIYSEYSLCEKSEYEYNTSGKGQYIFKGYYLSRNYKYQLKDNVLSKKSDWDRDAKTIYSKEQIEAMDFKDISIKLENGSKIKISEY